MSLNFDLTRINATDRAAIKTPEEWPVTEGLIFVTMAVGLNEITLKNIDEWAIRLRLYAAVNPNAARLEAGLHARIGLHTNASRMTRPQFLKLLADNIERDVQWQRRNAASTAA